jgi:hypothetical protein
MLKTAFSHGHNAATFALFQKVAARHAINHLFIDDCTPLTLFLWKNIVVQLTFG